MVQKAERVRGRNGRPVGNVTRGTTNPNRMRRLDRWLAAHPGATSIGVAWSQGQMCDAEFAPQPHDIALTLVITEQGVVG